MKKIGDKNLKKTMKKIKISVDFDGTLTLPKIQELIGNLSNVQTEVHILTSRFGNMQRLKYKDLKSNEEIYRIAGELNIPMHRISYTDQMPKWMVLNESGIDIHLDDDKRELDSLKYYDKVKGFDINSPRFEEEFFDYLKALIEY